MLQWMNADCLAGMKYMTGASILKAFHPVHVVFPGLRSVLLCAYTFTRKQQEIKYIMWNVCGHAVRQCCYSLKVRVANLNCAKSSIYFIKICRCGVQILLGHPPTIGRIFRKPWISILHLNHLIQQTHLTYIIPIANLFLRLYFPETRSNTKFSTSAPMTCFFFQSGPD